MKYKLSISVTIIFKFIIPIFWFFIVGYYVFGLYLTKDKYFFHILSIWILFLIYLYIYHFSLKVVQMDNDHLYISNYLKTIKVHISAIKDVNDDYYTRPPKVKITFNDKTEFGKYIYFIPIPYRDKQSYEHTVVLELKKRIKEYNEKL